MEKSDGPRQVPIIDMDETVLLLSITILTLLHLMSYSMLDPCGC